MVSESSIGEWMSYSGLGHLPLAALSWLGRQGTRALAALVVIGIALPSLGTLLRPYLTAAVFILLCIAFLRLDITAFKACLSRPAIVIAATAWTSFVVPILFGFTCLGVGLDKKAPDLFLALMLQAIASPMMAAPALAALMGLDATLALVTLIISTALIPLTAPIFASLVIGSTLSLRPPVLAARLLMMLAGAGLTGLVGRRVFGVAAIERRKESIDGLNILILFSFVAAVMSGVDAQARSAPMTTLALLGLAFVVFFVIVSLTAVLFLPAGRERALALGLVASQRNMGLMLAVCGRSLPDLTWLYFALSQFPIYLSPQLLQPLARRILAGAPKTASRVREPPES